MAGADTFGAFARSLGLRPGDLIARIDGTEIESVAQLTEVLSVERDEWELTVERDGKVKTVTVR